MLVPNFDENPIPNDEDFGPPGHVYWITGFAGAGKSTFARALSKHLRSHGLPNFLLDSDSIRPILGPKFGFNREDRRDVAMIYSRLAKDLSAQGHEIVCVTVSMFEDVRQWNRANLPGYFEVFVRAPQTLIAKRHPGGLLARAMAGRVHNVPGVDQYAEEPINPDLVINNSESTNLDALRAFVAQVPIRSISADIISNSIDKQGA